MRFTSLCGVLLFQCAGCSPVCCHAQTKLNMDIQTFTPSAPCAYFYKKEVCALFMVNVIAIVAGVLAGLAAGFVLGMVYRKKVAEKEIGSAEMEATRLINEAIRSGENRKKEMLLEAKDEIHKSRTEHDKEVKERRAELSKQERRLEQ